MLKAAGNYAWPSVKIVCRQVLWTRLRFDKHLVRVRVGDHDIITDEPNILCMVRPLIHGDRGSEAPDL